MENVCLKHINSIKEIVLFLNNSNDADFSAIIEKFGRYWLIVCSDFEMYQKDEEFKLCKEAVKLKYSKKFKVVFCCIIGNEWKCSHNGIIVK